MPWRIAIAVLVLLLVVHCFYMLNGQKANKVAERFAWAKPVILGLLSAFFGALPLCFGGGAFDWVTGGLAVGLGLCACIMAFVGIWPAGVGTEPSSRPTHNPRVQSGAASR